MKLIADARHVFKKAWSVKLTLLASVLSAIEGGVQYYLTGTPAMFAIGASLISLGAAFARVVAQDELKQP